jgi:ergothioneine biosynthesis protein EgtB
MRILYPTQQVKPAISDLAERFVQVRMQTLALAAPLSPEDCQAQSMPDASPVKWHLAHVTWFFETFILERYEAGFQPFNAAFRVLFNSYYNAVGDKHPRPQRGLLTRPSLQEIKRWREDVDMRMCALLSHPHDAQVDALVELGIHHEQQHQELLLTDVKHLLSCSSLQPVYAKSWPLARVAPAVAQWLPYPSAQVNIGHARDHAFAFDNELPQHAHYLGAYALMNRLVTHGEWLEFVNAGAYQDPQWWLSAGWDWVCRETITAPLYWQRDGYAEVHDGWTNFTLHGRVPIDPHTPIVHISFFEADAYARWKSTTDEAWAGARLPTEQEWEAAVMPDEQMHLQSGNFAESRALHPMPVAKNTNALMQALGDVWQWTASSYNAYPGYEPWPGAVGEYNGKFMVNQYVLRGGSCVSPQSHIRASYRNFFPTDARWQFSGLRLAKTLH